MTGAVEMTDDELVVQSLTGNRDAFGQIVARYQSLVCSLAYSATGSLTHSEDLSQETFVTAWKQLRQLREPGKLRSWLCGIARNLINNWLRQQGREPSHAAEALDTVSESLAPEPMPHDNAISREEEAIMWRSLERIPEIYREPLVLFYREGESVERVAAAMELSEDAVKQRLSRGRKLLHEQVLALVEGTLRQTAPGKAFTLGVVAALPLLATTATAATAAVTATKGSSAAKAASGAGALSAFLTGGMMVLFSLFGLFGFSGRWLGRKMGRASQQSARGRERIIQFWRTLAVGFLVLVLPALLLPGTIVYSRPWLFRAQTWSLSAFYWLVAAALAIWVWQRWRDARRREVEAAETTRTPGRSYYVWVTLGMIGPAWILGAFIFAICFTSWPLSFKPVSDVEARSIISERQDALFTVYQYKDGSRSLSITLPEEHRIIRSTPVNDSLLLALTEKGIAYQSRIETRDFNNGGVRGWMLLLSTFIVVAGTALLLRRPGTQKFFQQEIAAQRAEEREKKIVGVCAALALIAAAILIGLMTNWNVHTLSGTEAQKMIAGHKDARFEVFQYNNGSKELWITVQKNRRPPEFVAPADEPTLSTLAGQGIAYRTHVQGKDFGFSGPNRWLSLLCISLLSAGAVTLLRWVWKRKRMIPAFSEATV